MRPSSRNKPIKKNPYLDEQSQIELNSVQRDSKEIRKKGTIRKLKKVQSVNANQYKSVERKLSKNQELDSNKKPRINFKYESPNQKVNNPYYKEQMPENQTYEKFLRNIEKQKEKTQKLLQKIRKSHIQMEQKQYIAEIGNQQKIEPSPQFLRMQNKNEHGSVVEGNQNVDANQIRLSINRFDQMIQNNKFKDHQDQYMQKPDFGEYRFQRKVQKKKKIPSKLICQICYNMQEQYKMVKLFKCAHLFCEGCISQFVESRLKQHKLFTCPSCHESYDENSVFFLNLNLEEQQKLITINRRKQVQRDPELKFCPNPKCEEGVLKLESRHSKAGRCNLCFKSFCFSCMLPTHSGKCEDTGASFLKKQFNYNKCPQCGRIIERIQGCPHMKCPCGKQFCYNCLETWVNFGHRCPEKKDEEMKRRIEERRRRQEEERRQQVQLERRRKRELEEKKALQKNRKQRLKKIPDNREDLEEIRFFNTLHFTFERQESQDLCQVQCGGNVHLRRVSILLIIILWITPCILYTVFCFLMLSIFLYIDLVHSTTKKVRPIQSKCDCAKAFFVVFLLIILMPLLWVFCIINMIVASAYRKIFAKVLADFWFRGRFLRLQCI